MVNILCLHRFTIIDGGALRLNPCGCDGISCVVVCTAPGNRAAVVSDAKSPVPGHSAFHAHGLQPLSGLCGLAKGVQRQCAGASRSASCWRTDSGASASAGVRQTANAPHPVPEGAWRHYLQRDTTNICHDTFMVQQRRQPLLRATAASSAVISSVASSCGGWRPGTWRTTFPATRARLPSLCAGLLDTAAQQDNQNTDTLLRISRRRASRSSSAQLMVPAY